MSNIILIGMPGAGKSTIGRPLASATGRSFIDIDQLIKERDGRPLQNIIDSSGLDHFTSLEEKTILELRVENTIIATGGSAIYSSQSMKYLKSQGAIVYLKVSYQEIDNRINNMNNRGIVIRKDQSLRDLYQERIPFYDRYADIIIDNSKLTIEETIKLIVEKI